MDRFYIPPARWADSLALSGEEAHHCRRVMRKQVGDVIEIFNGEGSWARGAITHLGNEVAIEVTESGETPKPTLEVELAVGIPKGKTFDLVIQKSVELGVLRIQPLITEQGMVRFDGKDAVRKAEKWSRLALEACKQCGQNWLPEVLETQNFSAWLPNRVRADFEIISALTEESKPLRDVLPEIPASGFTRVFVGPEGDFSPAEYELAAETSMHPASLGPLVLRVETAVIYLLSNIFCQIRS
ncbi:MAG: RsmE family RNA methyltransferase [Akkermansiaceae bacterium]